MTNFFTPLFLHTEFSMIHQDYRSWIYGYI